MIDINTCDIESDIGDKETKSEQEENSIIEIKTTGIVSISLTMTDTETEHTDVNDQIVSTNSSSILKCTKNYKQSEFETRLGGDNENKCLSSRRIVSSDDDSACLISNQNVTYDKNKSFANEKETIPFLSDKNFNDIKKISYSVQRFTRTCFNDRHSSYVEVGKNPDLADPRLNRKPNPSQEVMELEILKWTEKNQIKKVAKEKNGCKPIPSPGGHPCLKSKHKIKKHNFTQKKLTNMTKYQFHIKADGNSKKIGNSTTSHKQKFHERNKTEIDSTLKKSCSSSVNVSEVTFKLDKKRAIINESKKKIDREHNAIRNFQKNMSVRKKHIQRKNIIKSHTEVCFQNTNELVKYGGAFPCCHVVIYPSECNKKTGTSFLDSVNIDTEKSYFNLCKTNGQFVKVLNTDDNLIFSEENKNFNVSHKNMEINRFLTTEVEESIEECKFLAERVKESIQENNIEDVYPMTHNSSHLKKLSSGTRSRESMDFKMMKRVFFRKLNKTQTSCENTQSTHKESVIRNKPPSKVNLSFRKIDKSKFHEMNTTRKLYDIELDSYNDVLQSHVPNGSKDFTKKNTNVSLPDILKKNKLTELFGDGLTDTASDSEAEISAMETNRKCLSPKKMSRHERNKRRMSLFYKESQVKLEKIVKRRKTMSCVTPRELNTSPDVSRRNRNITMQIDNPELGKHFSEDIPKSATELEITSIEDRSTSSNGEGAKVTTTKKTTACPSMKQINFLKRRKSEPCQEWVQPEKIQKQKLNVTLHNVEKNQEMFLKKAVKTAEEEEESSETIKSISDEILMPTSSIISHICSPNIRYDGNSNEDILRILNDSQINLNDQDTSKHNQISKARIRSSTENYIQYCKHIENEISASTFIALPEVMQNNISEQARAMRSAQLKYYRADSKIQEETETNVLHVEKALIIEPFIDLTTLNGPNNFCNVVITNVSNDILNKIDTKSDPDQEEMILQIGIGDGLYQKEIKQKVIECSGVLLDNIKRESMEQTVDETSKCQIKSAVSIELDEEFSEEITKIPVTTFEKIIPEFEPVIEYFMKAQCKSTDVYIAEHHKQIENINTNEKLLISSAQETTSSIQEVVSGQPPNHVNTDFLPRLHLDKYQVYHDFQTSVFEILKGYIPLHNVYCKAYEDMVQTLGKYEHPCNNIETEKYAIGKILRERQMYYGWFLLNSVIRILPLNLERFCLKTFFINLHTSLSRIELRVTFLRLVGYLVKLISVYSDNYLHHETSAKFRKLVELYYETMNKRMGQTQLVPIMTKEQILTTKSQIEKYCELIKNQRIHSGIDDRPPQLTRLLHPSKNTSTNINTTSIVNEQIFNIREKIPLSQTLRRIITPENVEVQGMCFLQSSNQSASKINKSSEDKCKESYQTQNKSNIQITGENIGEKVVPSHSLHSCPLDPQNIINIDKTTYRKARVLPIQPEFSSHSFPNVPSQRRTSIIGDSVKRGASPTLCRQNMSAMVPTPALSHNLEHSNLSNHTDKNKINLFNNKSLIDKLDDENNRGSKTKSQKNNQLLSFSENVRKTISTPENSSILNEIQTPIAVGNSNSFERVPDITLSNLLNSSRKLTQKNGASSICENIATQLSLENSLGFKNRLVSNINQELSAQINSHEKEDSSTSYSSNCSSIEKKDSLIVSFKEKVCDISKLGTSTVSLNQSDIIHDSNVEAKTELPITIKEEDPEFNFVNDVIDLTWLDDFLEEDMVKEESHDEFLSVKIKSPDANLVPNSPGDSGIGSPSVQMECPDLILDNRSCLCGVIAIYLCSCNKVMYCSQQCQLSDWTKHQKFCCSKTH